MFEEAIAEAALLLGGGCKIVDTVRGSGAAVDAAFWAGRLSREVTHPKTWSRNRLLLLICSMPVAHLCWQSAILSRLLLESEHTLQVEFDSVF